VIANIPVSGSEQPPAPTLEQVQTVIDQRGPKGLVAFDPIWLAGFRINARKVENYRSGRVFLSGDAAHVHSPAGGEGMNTGMQDAFNLAWKLALVIRGTCGAQLLDTYSPERSKIGDEVLKNTARLTAVGTLQSPLAQELRNLVGHIALGLSPVRHALTNTMSQITVGYPDSPMNGPALAGTAGPRPGGRVEPVQGQPPIGAGDSPRFALLAEPTQETSDLLTTFPKILEAETRSPPDPRGLWLVRPDGYVAMAAAPGDGKAISDFLRRVSH
jgi:FAD binding domain